MSLRPVHNAAKTQAHSPQRRRSKWVIALWVVFALIALALLVIGWLWSQRFEIIEKEVKSQLEAQGIDAEFDITGLSETSAQVENIVLRDQGKSFLSAENANITYVWRSAMEGQFKTLVISGAEITLTLGEDLRPDLSFLDKIGSNDSSNDPAIERVEIKDSSAIIQSPIGLVSLDVDAEYQAENNFSARINLSPSDIAYGDLSANISGPIAISRIAEHPDYEVDLNVPNWRYKELSGSGVKLTGDGRLATGPLGVDISGNYAASFDSFAGRAVFTKRGQIGWQGRVSIPRRADGVIEAVGDWQADVTEIAMPDRTRRKAIADRVALYDSLSKAPVTENFAKPLSNILSDLLKGAGARASGTIAKDENSTNIHLSESLNWYNERYKIIAQNVQNKAVYRYHRDDALIDLAFNAELDADLPLKIQNGHLAIRSTNGRNLKGVNSFRANVSLPRAWSGSTSDGLAVRLMPTQARVNYEGGKNRNLKMIGQIAYDGNIPGGKVMGLKAQGELHVDVDGGPKVYFTPEANSLVTMARFETQAPWLASNVKFTLTPDQHIPLFARSDKGGNLRAQIRGVETDLTSADGLRSMHLIYERADIQAQINPGQQKWHVIGEAVTMTSDNIPSAGTVMTAANSNLVLEIREGQSPNFSLETPSADIRTDMVKARGLSVKAEGVPEQFRIDYRNGVVDLRDDELPGFNMTGFVNYADNAWRGKADSFLPFGAKTPLDITYSLENGRGIADVDIPEMIFSPRKLQPQMFIPALRGKIADVRGTAQARIHIEFAEGEPMTSSGWARLNDVSLGTLPGPITGLNSELKFSSFFPLVTDGHQTITLKSFDPGFPLPDGEVTFETVPDGVMIHKARWPLGSGSVSLDPTEWKYSAPENRMKMRIENVELGEFFGAKNFKATGNVNGVLPVVISGVNVEVEEGRLAVKDGGIIRYQSSQTDAATAENEIAGYAFDALKELHYDELEAIFNGPLDGLIVLRLKFEGSNPKVLGGAIFKFNVKLEGELLNIARNFKLGDRIAEEVSRAIQQDSPMPDN